MFTGIITDIGTILRLEKKGDTSIIIRTCFDTATIALGASIACSGVCLTVIEKGINQEGHWFKVELSAETVSRTTATDWQIGTRLNLERALRVGDELGGHIVTGHVDGVGKVVSIKEVGDSHELVFEAPEALKAYIAEKGSVTVDGISLTVNKVEDTHFWINMIPHTWTHTASSTYKVGTKVNIEIDILARYMARMLSTSVNHK